jgi:hypothetical protein
MVFLNATLALRGGENRKAAILKLAGLDVLEIFFKKRDVE